MLLQERINYKKIKAHLTHSEQVLHIHLATPPANILDAVMMREICTCLEHEASEKKVKAILFEGEGNHFCFGASVEDHRKEQAPEMIHDFHTMFKKLLDSHLPLIALVRGQCLGGGMELAAFCNFVIAEPSAKFGQPEIKLGVFPPVAALVLPDIIGQLRADDLILTGRSIDAETAHAWGIVHQIAENGDEAVKDFLTKRILPKSASSLKHAVRAVRSKWISNWGTKLDEMEHLYVKELMETSDANEGIVAFLEKRPPKWKNT